MQINFHGKDTYQLHFTSFAQVSAIRPSAKSNFMCSLAAHSLVGLQFIELQSTPAAKAPAHFTFKLFLPFHSWGMGAGKKGLHCCPVSWVMIGSTWLCPCVERERRDDICP